MARALTAVADELAGQTPRGAHLEMVGAVLAGDGLERVAEIASAHAGAPVAVIVPRLGVGREPWARYERYVAARLSGGRPQRPSEVTAEVPISSGGRQLGAVLLLGRGGPDAGDYLHMAAIAALTEVAVAEARDETEQSLRGSFLEEVLSRPELEAAEVERRALRLGFDLDAGYVALCTEANGRVRASLAAEVPGVLAQAVGPSSTRCSRGSRSTPGGWQPASDATPRSGCPPTAPAPPRYGGHWRRQSSCWGSRPPAAARPATRSARAPTACCSACWRATRRRCAASTTTPSRRSWATTTSTRPTCSAPSPPTSTTTATWRPRLPRSTRTATRSATGSTG